MLMQWPENGEHSPNSSFPSESEIFSLSLKILRDKNDRVKKFMPILVQSCC